MKAIYITNINCFRYREERKIKTLEDKLNEFLKELFWYEGVKEEDWKIFLECINRAEMIKQLKVGIKNGFSTEKQFQIIRKVIKQNNDKTTKMQ